MVRSTDDGWMHASSSGSISMRPFREGFADAAVGEDHGCAR
jgi:hypothetical protein